METIKSGKTEYFIKRDDLNDFSEKSIELLTDRTLQEKFSKEAENHIKENFNFECSFQILELLIKKALKKNIKRKNIIKL